jgi:glutamate carboxypeptidase
MPIASELIEMTRWLDDCGDEMLELVCRLCNQNSGTFHLEGLKKVRQILAAEFEPIADSCEVFDTEMLESISDAGQVVETELGQGLIIRRREQASRQVLLCIHMDTVYGTDHPFQDCQMIDEGTLNGPGVIDAKGGLVVMLYALRAFEKSPLAENLGWRVLINPDEEIGSPGSHRIIQELARGAEVGLLFEPALPDGSLVSWRRGSGAFVFVVHGRSAHAGRDFAAGRNAIVAMSRLMAQIHDLNVSPEITFNVGRVSGGGALNIVPDQAIGRVNVRVKAVEQQAHAEQQLRALVERLQRDHDGIRVEMHGRFTSPPKVVDAGTDALMRRIEVCGEALGQPIRFAGSGGASDGNKFSIAGLPNIDSLGPEGGEIHSSREFLKIDSLVRKAKLTALAMLTMAHEGANERAS